MNETIERAIAPHGGRRGGPPSEPTSSMLYFRALLDTKGFPNPFDNYRHQHETTHPRCVLIPYNGPMSVGSLIPHAFGPSVWMAR